MEIVIVSYIYRSGLIENVIAFYIYRSENMTKAITCNSITFWSNVADLCPTQNREGQDSYVTKTRTELCLEKVYFTKIPYFRQKF